MRRILEVLETAPEGRLDRVELERVLVEAEGFDASNVLRAIKALARKKHHVGFKDRRHKKDSVICLPREVRHFTHDEILRLLSENGGER